jgi:hypothetical protein
LSRAVARYGKGSGSAAAELAADGVDISAGGSQAGVGLVQAISVGLLARLQAKTGHGLVGTVSRQTVKQCLKRGSPLRRPPCRAIRGGSAGRQTEPDPLTTQGRRRRIVIRVPARAAVPPNFHRPIDAPIRRRSAARRTRPSSQAERHPEKTHSRLQAHTNQDYRVSPPPLPQPSRRPALGCRPPSSLPTAARRRA